MTDERKKDLNFKLAKIAEELQEVLEEVAEIDVEAIMVDTMVSEVVRFPMVYIHYKNQNTTDGSRMVMLKNEEIKEAFNINRDDTVRKDNNDGENNAEE